MNSNSAVMGAASSSCVCVVVCVIAAIAIAVVLGGGFGGPKTLLDDGNPTLKDVVGKGPVISAAGVEAVVRVASTASSPAQVSATIRSQKGTAVKRSDLTAALRKVSLKNQGVAVNNLVNTSTNDVASINFGLAAMAYLLEDAPTEVYRDTTVTCPRDYLPCSAPEFNNYAGQGATQAFKKHGIPANQLCCRNANAAGDPRPSCKKSVQKARSTFSLIMMIVEIVLNLALIVPGVGIEMAAAKAAARAAAAAGESGAGAAATAAKAGFQVVAIQAEAASILASEAISATNTTVQAGLEGKPMRSCCKDDFFKGDPANSFVLKEYKDEQGATQLGAWNTDDGCPRIFNTPQMLEYSNSLGDAIVKLQKAFALDLASTNPFPNADKKNCTEGCMKIISYDQWLMANKKPIGCYYTCPSNVNQLRSGRCTMTCDTSGRSTDFVQDLQYVW